MGSATSSWPHYIFKPTGQLMLEIARYAGTTTNRAWWDRKTWPLENQIGDILEGIADAAEARIVWKRELEEQDRRWKEAEKRREELLRRKSAELKRREELLEQSKYYEQAAALRKLVSDFRSYSEKLPEAWTDEARARWIAWAERTASRLDPFRNGYFSEKLAQSEFEPELDCRPNGYSGFTI